MLRAPDAAPVQPAVPVDEQAEPLVRAGLRGFLNLDRFDVIAVAALITVAFVLRLASPIFPDFLNGGVGVSALGVGHPYNATGCATVPVGPN